MIWPWGTGSGEKALCKGEFQHWKLAFAKGNLLVTGPGENYGSVRPSVSPARRHKFLTAVTRRGNHGSNSSNHHDFEKNNTLKAKKDESSD
jgi:hypothetical protein